MKLFVINNTILSIKPSLARDVHMPMSTFFITLLLMLPFYLKAQQIADTTYNPPIHSPAYAPGEGPIIFIDEGHNNFHTKNGRYRAFSDLLTRDGYQALSYRGKFTKAKVAKGKILVISNALHTSNLGNWYLPNPSAFRNSEIKVIKQWVQEGGSLFLIADHMPMAGAAEDLGAAFDFKFTNGFVLDTARRGPAIFKLEDGTLAKSSITQGRNSKESVKQVASFTGQAIKLPSDATPILTFSKGYVNLLPDTAWVFDQTTRIQSAEGWSQGAYKKFGNGKIVVSGEAAMFTAQLAGAQRVKMGMSNSVAHENYQLLLNIIHWLDGKLE
ncbi:MAG: DUF4350 domain-containing protein [Bacteroidota bacterium]